MKGIKITQMFKNWTKYLWDWDKLNNPQYGMVELDLTNWCNANCSWCCSKREHNKEKCAMSMETFEKEIGLAIDHKYGVVFTGGGEPTLHPQFEEMVNVCSRLVNEGSIPAFSLVTNGILHEKARYFIEHTSEPQSWIRISVNYRKTSEELVKLFHDYPKRIGLQLI
jgi:MoaA/NifB/PqqE/SkfB family radical SAM enzyme